MRNIAKCKLCQSIIESFHDTDYVSCKCDEISVSGGSAMFCAAKDWNNFMRVDDEGNEIIVQIHEGDEIARELPAFEENKSKPSKNDLLKMLDEMINSIERLPKEAMYSPVNHCDLASALLLVSALFKSADCKDLS